MEAIAKHLHGAICKNVNEMTVKWCIGYALVYNFAQLCSRKIIIIAISVSEVSIVSSEVAHHPPETQYK